MEKSLDEEDDQTSGWLQVKKKHRSSSKFSLQGWVGGLSGKQTSNPSRNQGASVAKKHNSQGKFGNSNPRGKGDFPVQRQGPAVTVSSIPDKLKDAYTLDKSVVCDRQIETSSTKCKDESGAVQQITEKDNDHNLCQKIKWGDLDDEELTQHMKKSVDDIKSSGIINGKPDVDSSVVSSICSNVDVTANKEAALSVDSERNLSQPPSFVFGDADKCKDLDEVLLEDVKVDSTSKVLSNFDGNVSNVGKACKEQMETVNIDLRADVSPSVSAEMMNDELIRDVPGSTIMHEVTTSGKFDLHDEELTERDNEHNLCRKIKWGDLDDEELTQHMKKSVDDIKSSGIINGKPDVDSSAVSSICSNVDVTANKEAVISVVGERSLSRPPSFVFGDADKCKDLDEVLLEDAKVDSKSKEVSNFDGNVPNVGEECKKQMETVGIDLRADVSPSVSAEMIKGELIRNLPVSTTLHEVTTSGKLDAPLTGTGSEETGNYTDVDNQKIDKTGVDFPNTEVRSGNDAGDSAESRERFRQRLWCFLFENLNRAVDELYLLCELECDMEQMSEAILVLKEAALDFKELKSRVEKFENVKGSTSQVVEVPPVTLKSDHRRPHAVSWEVRRMTTSSHKAEILSSSLEAFRKIQQERAKVHAAGDAGRKENGFPSCDEITIDDPDKYSMSSCARVDSREAIMKPSNQNEASDIPQDNFTKERRNSDAGRSCKTNSTQKGQVRSQNPSASGVKPFKVSLKERSGAASLTHKIKREQMGSSSETERLPKKEKVLTESSIDKYPRSSDHTKKQNAISETDRDKKVGHSWKSMDAWKEKRNWEDILASPYCGSSRYSHSPGIHRKSAERARNLHVKLMSPEKKKKTALDWKKEAEQKDARATRIRNQLENEKIQKLQRSSEKLSRVNEWQAVRSKKLREGMYERHKRSESRHEAFLSQVVKRAGDESIKVNEVRFITSLNDENKKLIMRQKHQDSELRRAEKLKEIKSKQKEDIAREEAVLERKKLLEADKLQSFVDKQRRKEEAQVRREEERKASSAVREAKAIEHVRRKEIRAKAQQEEAELLAQKLAERLRESEQRRKFYLEQIRERASMDFRDQSSPFLRRTLNKDAQGRSITPTTSGDDYEGNNTEVGGSTLQTGNVSLQHSLKRRIKRIRQKLMSLKYEFSENPVEVENGGIGYRTAVGTARSKIGRWLQELQKLRQARKEGAASIGLITAEMIKFLEGKEPELHAARQAGLLDFIASALPASHTSKPEAYQVTIYFLRLLKVVLSLPANGSYFIAQNLLPPIIPILAATLENYIKIAASSNVPASSDLLGNKTSAGILEAISEALDGFLWTVATVTGHVSSDERQLQMQDGLLELVLAYQVIHRLRDLFALYDRPQVEGSPFPSSIHLSINLLAVLTSRSREISSISWGSLVIEKGPELVALNNSISLPEVPEDEQGFESCVAERNKESVDYENSTGIKIDSTLTNNLKLADGSQNVLMDESVKPTVPQKDEKSAVGDSAEQKNDNRSDLKASVKFLLSAISETGLVCLPSLLTAVLLQANNRLSSEQAPHVLPSNFEEVATGVLKVLNNLAFIDISFMQKMLARPDLKMEFFHLMSFLLAYCTSKWRVATDQVGLLLMESLLLLGYFSLFHPANQAVLRWGKSPTILHKVCDLPFVFFSDPELMPVLAGTLVAACYGCEQNKDVIQQELSTDMLLSLLKSCRNSSSTGRSSSSPEKLTSNSPENNQSGADSKRNQSDVALKSSRQNLRSSRISCTKSGASWNGNGSRSGKIRNQRDNKTLKPNEETSLKRYNSPPDFSSVLMLHSRFSDGFIDRAEQFFAAETTVSGDV